MIGRNTSFLGLAFAADQSIACAQVSVVAGAATLNHAATFVFPEGTSLESPGAAGQALAAFLRQNRFGSSRAVVGVPARWLVAVEKDLPPADEATAQAALRLQAERLAVAENDTMIFDFAGAPHRSVATKVLLVGMPRQRLEQVQKLLDAAGMSIVAVTSNSLALGAAMGDSESGVLTLGRSGCELVWRQDGSPRMLRHVTMALNGHETPSVVPMTAELRRIVALTGSNGTSDSRSLALVDSLGLDEGQINELAGRLGVTVKSKSPRDMLGVSSTIPAAAEVMPAIALALIAAKQKLPLDFEHSRLTPAAPKRFGRRAVWAGTIGAVALIVLAWMLIGVTQRQSKLDALKQKLNNPDLVAAKAAIERLNFGRGFFAEGRPSSLDCLREVSLAFRNDEKIWTTGFTVRENGKCTLTGKAGDQRTILRVLDGLKQGGKLTDVKLIDMREADTRGSEMTFSIGFTYTGAG